MYVYMPVITQMWKKLHVLLFCIPHSSQYISFSIAASQPILKHRDLKNDKYFSLFGKLIRHFSFCTRWHSGGDTAEKPKWPHPRGWQLALAGSYLGLLGGTHLSSRRIINRLLELPHSMAVWGQSTSNLAAGFYECRICFCNLTRLWYKIPLLAAPLLS